MNPLRELEQQGQSVWLDFITRQFMADGKLAKLINEDGLKGVTSNPTIFQKAIEGGAEYDTAISQMIREGKSAVDIIDALIIQDIQRACDILKPAYDRTRGADGFVSIEVSPLLARETKETLQEARRLFRVVGRPNVMVKIPATEEGLPAIEQALGEGININITLIFALERYQEVIDAWLSGLERLAKSNKPLNSVNSVASFFVSRVDTLVDGLLEKKSQPNLMGKAAIANAQQAYSMFEDTVGGKRFKALEAKGARVQRPLWASTSTKNPKYRDVLYPEELIGKDTVDTLPLATIDAFRDHGHVQPTLPVPREKSTATLKALNKAGIDMKAVTKRLEDEGVKLFSNSYESLLKSLEEKKEALKVRT